MRKYISASVEETENIAYEIAKTVSAPQVICLIGELGAGKTAFARGFVRAFGINKGVCSPTFTIMHRYEGEKTIDHYDLYRINSVEELEETGFFEQIEHNISLVEWADMFLNNMPSESIFIRITKGERDDDRIITRSDKNDDACS
ncbi:MAG: tRNA (adenosine(37)-N6)-threonylcarbamoyltransferase complex ATPase subunit type 1 TsaE [Clostridia bacterium]|nr:tRNA (adenosine(37)-N6)-threonylcarbamoyltransferase complex ATPase subunit type 1 TsaE [Clostridia bacterium]